MENSITLRQDLRQLSKQYLSIVLENGICQSEKKAKQFASLISFSETKDINEILLQPVPENIAIQLVSFSSDLSLTAETIRQSKQIRTLNRFFGDQSVLNLLVLIIGTFAQNLGVKNSLSPSAMLDCAITLQKHFYTESIEDILLALQKDKTKATSFLINAWVYQHVSEDKELNELITEVKALRNQWHKNLSDEDKATLRRSDDIVK